MRARALHIIEARMLVGMVGRWSISSILPMREGAQRRQGSGSAIIIAAADE